MNELMCLILVRSPNGGLLADLVFQSCYVAQDPFELQDDQGTSNGTRLRTASCSPSPLRAQLQGALTLSAAARHCRNAAGTFPMPRQPLHPLGDRQQCCSYATATRSSVSQPPLQLTCVMLAPLDPAPAPACAQWPCVTVRLGTGLLPSGWWQQRRRTHTAVMIQIHQRGRTDPGAP